MLETDHRSVERREAGAFELRWSARGAPGPVRVHVGHSPDSIDFAKVVAETEEQQVLVELAEPPHRPYFGLARGDQRLVVAERRVPLDGACNFRDLGGYATRDGRRVRWGACYRSDRLSELSANDQVVLRALDLALVCDLRDSRERAERPNKLDPGTASATANLSVEVRAAIEMEALLMGGERDLTRLRGVVFGGYRDYVDVNREIWAELFRTVLRARAGAVVIHCSAGQDRTGFASALLLLALGVPRDVVLADYMLTNVYRPGETAVEDIEESPVPRSLLVDIWRPGAAFLEASFEAMESGYGSVDGYLASIGLDDRAQAALRERLLA